MSAAKKFRVGITPIFPGGSKEMLAPALAEVFDPLPDLEFEFIEDASVVARAEVIDQFDALLVLGYRYPPSAFEGIKRLACLSLWGVGYDGIDVPACTAADVMIAIATNAVRRPVAEGALAFILSLSKQMPEWDQRVRQGRWRSDMTSSGVCFQGRTLGSIGLGNIAGEFFRMTRQMGFGRQIACDPFAPPQRAAELGVELVDFETAMRESDYLTINTFLNGSTRHLIDERALSLMKSSAYLINTARGAIVDEHALYQALKEKRIAGAGLDVLEQEPPDPANRLFQLENVQLAPHSISWTEEGIRDISLEACQSIREVYAGRPPVTVANREVLGRPGLQAKLADQARRA